MKVYKGYILSCDSANHTYNYLVEDKGRILYVGDTLDANYQSIPVIDLGEQALLPAFVDTHLHFASMAMFHSGINVMDASSNQDIQDNLRDFLPKTKAKIIIGFGASPHSVKDSVLLSREDLDKVSSKRPIMIVKYDGHACIINSALLEKLPSKIQHLRGYDPNSGQMNQEAFFAVSDYVTGTISIKDLIRSMQEAIDYMASKGIGMIHTVSGVGFFRDLDVDIERFMGRSAQHGFQMRLFFQTMDVLKVTRRKLPRIGGCFATALDGCFGSMDAALNEPYENSQNSGILYYDDQTVIDFCKKANRANLQIELHAIGDAAFDQACRSIKAALDDYPRKDHRHGIIHACLPTKEGLDICRDYQIQLPVQTAFIDWTQEPDTYLEKILGSRAMDLNPLRTFNDYHIPISFGSDAPCTDPDPILWIHKACNHSNPKQSLTVFEALRSATYEGYRASFDEKERGILKAGYYADMVILSHNPYQIPLEKLKEIQIKALFLQGIPYKSQSQTWIMSLIKGLKRTKAL